MDSTTTLTPDARPLSVEALEAEANDRALGVVAYGPAPAALPRAPVARVPLVPLGGEPAAEVWAGSRPVRTFRRGSLELAGDARVLFGHLRRRDGDSGDLESAALASYRELLAAIAAAGCPELLRVWACVPRINEEEGGLERYKAFCRARATAFEEAWGSGFTRRLPASTAVGSESGDLVIHFLAARSPGVHVENPRQVSAYLYPQAYGPRSPSFARATRAPAELGDLLFVSGTSSIVGHASRHPDLAEQARETVRNLERVRRVVERLGDPAGGYAWAQLKVYLRRAGDEAEARRLVAELVGDAVPTLFLRADVCRRELLIEIEAVARPRERRLSAPSGSGDPRPPG